MRLVLSPAGLVLPLVFIVVAVYLIAPEVLARQRSMGRQELAPAAEIRYRNLIANPSVRWEMG